MHDGHWTTGAICIALVRVLDTQRVVEDMDILGTGGLLEEVNSFWVMADGDVLLVIKISDIGNMLN